MMRTTLFDPRSSKVENRLTQTLAPGEEIEGQDSPAKDNWWSQFPMTMWASGSQAKCYRRMIDQKMSEIGVATSST